MIARHNHLHRHAALPMLFSSLTALTLSLSCGNDQPRAHPAATAAIGSDQAQESLNLSQPAQLFAGVATHFDNLGYPYGGCGVPEAVLESSNYVALNVQNTPNDYASQLVRPIADGAKVGSWDNGRNCGRWVRVTIGQSCIGGVNSGEPGKKICQGGSWQANEHTGATLNMIVADSCQDGNSWCRDSQYHLDLSTSSLSHFKKPGVDIVGLANNWSNPQITWQFIDAPDYQGDIDIGFSQNASPYWPAVIITKLPRGLHGVEVNVDGHWQKAGMVSDMGQAYVLPANPGRTFAVRLYDANDALINGGRVYQFAFPQSCGNRCQASYTKVAYSVRSGASR